jgi:hypothetical protein
MVPVIAGATNIMPPIFRQKVLLTAFVVMQLIYMARTRCNAVQTQFSNTKLPKAMS